MKTFTNEEMSIFENIFSFFEEREDECVHRVEFPVKNQLSNRVTNLASLADINQKKGFKAYYFECNVNATKQYFYLAAKLRAETCKYSTGWDMASINPFIFALLSDSREMIDIYSHLDTKNNSIFYPDQRPPLKESYHLPKDARFPVLVFQHVLQWEPNKSSFTISKDELKSILQLPEVIGSPARKSPSSNYIRTIVLDKEIGIDAKSYNKTPTKIITIITDSKGNLVNTFPGATGL